MKLRLNGFILVFLLSTHLFAQESGRLRNGLEYYLLHNETAKEKASIRLVLKVGMLDESEDQKGFAHFVEHLTWRGTENFSEQQFEEELLSLGITDSEHMMSWTGMDATVFRFNIALNHPQALERVLFILKEMVSSATFLPAAITDEREEVIEDLKDELAGTQLQKIEQQASVLLKRPVHFYSEGVLESTQNATPEQLQSFYRSKYRPDQMALIAVGDFDEQSLKKSVEDLFGSLTNPTPEKEYRGQEEHLNLEKQVVYLLQEHESFHLPKISAAYLLPRALEKNTRETLLPLMTQRLQCLVEEGSILTTWMNHTPLSKTHQLIEVGVVLFDETAVAKNIRRFMDEINRIEQLGFAEEEWSALQEKIKNSNPIGNSVYTRIYTDQFLGYPSSIPLQALQGNKGAARGTHQMLKMYPKVITVAARSREVLNH